MQNSFRLQKIKSKKSQKNYLISMKIENIMVQNGKDMLINLVMLG